MALQTLFVFCLTFNLYGQGNMKVIVKLNNIYCSGVDDGRVGSLDGEELFGFLQAFVSTPTKALSGESKGLEPSKGERALWKRNSNEVLKLKKKASEWVNKTVEFSVSQNEIGRSEVLIYGDLDELDGNGVPRDVDEVVKDAPYGKLISRGLKIFHRDGNDKLEKWKKTDEKIKVPLVALRNGGVKNLKQRFGSGGTVIEVFWTVEVVKQ